jgi:AraC family transcriptional regulator, exoenzyme S synthesis regulatory protein ExsA
MDNYFDFIKEYPPVKRIQVNDLLLAEYQCPLSEHRYDIWSHNNYFIYAISGNKKWLTRTQEYLVRKGDCLFVRKGAHSVYQYFNAEFCALVLFMPDDFIRSVLINYQIPGAGKGSFKGHESLFSIEADQQIRAYFHSFLSYLSPDQPPVSKLLEHKFQELILLLAVKSAPAGLRKYFCGLCNESKPSIREIMEENYSYPMELNEYARLSNRSLSAFKRDFRETFGTSPGKWMKQKRLEQARYLLSNTRKSVTEVMVDSGFTNHSHFTRIFKETFNMTPLECSKKDG